MPHFAHSPPAPFPTNKISYANWIANILRRNCILKHAIEQKGSRKKSGEDEEEDVYNYWMTLTLWPWSWTFTV